MHVLEIKEYLVFVSFYLIMKFKMPNTFSLHSKSISPLKYSNVFDSHIRSRKTIFANVWYKFICISGKKFNCELSFCRQECRVPIPCVTLHWNGECCMEFSLLPRNKRVVLYWLIFIFERSSDDNAFDW